VAKKRKTPSYHGEQGQYLGDDIDRKSFKEATGDAMRERNVSLRSPYSKVARKDWDTEIIKRERKGIKMDFKKGGRVGYAHGGSAHASGVRRLTMSKRAKGRA